MSQATERPRSGPDEEAERVFLEHLERHERGEPGDLDALCRLHAPLAAELRELAAHWELAMRLRGSALARLDADPQVAVASRPASLAALYARLSVQGSAADRYRDEGEIARGAQGAVRRTFDATLQRHVAKKVLHEPRERDAPPGADGAAPGSSRRLGRFLEEAQVTAQLEHPAIVPVHELGLDVQGAVYFTMKLVKGRSLHEVLQARAAPAGSSGPGAESWTTTRLLGALVRVAEAMAFAHDRGVVHRDLKPANIMLGDYGEVYVMDWGLARVLRAGAGKPAGADSDPQSGPESLADRRAAGHAPPTDAVRSGRRDVADEAPGSSLLTHDGDVVGTPQYMAPEQAAGELARLGPAADVYALGAMLYHVLAGRPPYDGSDGASPAEMLAAVRSRAPAPLRRVAPDVAPELEAICEKAMARDAARRYASMGDVAADLRAFLERRVVRAYETGPLAELRKWVRRNRALTAAGAGVLLAVFGGLFYASRVETAGRLRAEAAQGEADRRLAEVLRLSDVQRLERLRRDADGLWPADPQHVGALQAWLDEARSLSSRTGAHRATLEGLRARAQPATAEDSRRDREDPQLAEELRMEQESLATLQAMLATEDGRPGANPARRSVILRKLKLRQEAIARVQAAQGERRTWRFASEEDAWWHTMLAGLLDGVQRLELSTVPSVGDRLRRAQELEQRSLQEPAALWDHAIASIADPLQCPRYGGLRIAPQLGLVPLGRNELTGLWEFWDIQLGERPVQGADGRFAIAPESGLLFVLVPGGTFLFGAQGDDPDAPNYDPWLDVDNSRVQEVRLDPCFMSACEVTQAQWERAMGTIPSIYQAPNITCGNEYTDTNPVESISWGEAKAMAARFGFALPTEAQWEYACRAGTTSTWWTGDAPLSLQGAANVADAWLDQHGGGGWDHEPGLQDGHAAHAPVGSYRPNPFGLYDMLGNVAEWARDPWGDPPPDALPGEGTQPGGNPVVAAVRGGSWFDGPARATSSERLRSQLNLRNDRTGLRVMRRLQP